MTIPNRQLTKNVYTIIILSQNFTIYFILALGTLYCCDKISKNFQSLRDIFEHL